jgi:hypothetical protein
MMNTGSIKNTANGGQKYRRFTSRFLYFQKITLKKVYFVCKITKYVEQKKESQGFNRQSSCLNVSPLTVTQNSKQTQTPRQTTTTRIWSRYISLFGSTNPMTRISTKSKSAFQVLLNQLASKYWPMSGLTHHEHWSASLWYKVSCNTNTETPYLCYTHFTVARSLLFGVTIFYKCTDRCCRSQWQHGLRRRSAAARLLSSWVRIPPVAWKFVCCEGLFCQVEVSATSWSLAQRSPTDCGASLCVI